jgi:hypothetical protein
MATPLPDECRQLDALLSPGPVTRELKKKLHNLLRTATIRYQQSLGNWDWYPTSDYCTDLGLTLLTWRRTGAGLTSGTSRTLRRAAVVYARSWDRPSSLATKDKMTIQRTHPATVPSNHQPDCF